MAVLFHKRADARPELHGRPLTAPHRADDYDLDTVRVAFEDFMSHRLFFADGVRVPELSRVQGAGMSHVTFRARVSWSGAGNPSAAVVLRLPDLDAPAHDRIVREYRAQALLRRAGLPVPEPAWTGFDDPVLGDDFYVMQLVRGRSTTDDPPYHRAGWLREAGPDVQAAVWDQALSHLRDLHRIDWREGGFGFLAEGLPDSESPLTDALIDRIGSVIDTHGAGPDGARLAAALDWLERNAPEPAGEESLVWLDPHLSNFLFDGPNCTAMLDWESISIGDPALDLAALVWTDEQEQRLAGDRLPGIPSERETVTRYQDLLGQPMVNYPYYKILYGVLSASWLLLVHGRLVVRGALQGVEDEQVVPDETLEAIEDMIERL